MSSIFHSCSSWLSLPWRCAGLGLHGTSDLSMSGKVLEEQRGMGTCAGGEQQ